MKKIHIILSIVFLGMLTSCLKDQEDTFDKSADVRVREAIAADYKILASAENGWLMQYYPSPYQTFGGYNVIMKFTEDGKVTVDTEQDITAAAASAGVLNPATTATESLYKITQSAGVVLSFDTFNEIFHLFSTPDAPVGGETGEGLQGDYDFEIISASESEVVLKGKRSGNYAKMVPMTGDWDDYFSQVSELKNNLVFNDAVANIDGENAVMTLYHNDRWVEIKTPDSLVSMPFCYTPEGIKLYESVQVGSKDIEELKYDGEAGALIADDDAKTVFSGLIIPTIVVNNVGSAISCNNDAVVKEYTFNFADRFTYTPSVDWIKAPASGKKLTISIDANNTGNMRAGAIVIENQGQKAVITVSQMEVTDLIGIYDVTCLDRENAEYKTQARVVAAEGGSANDFILQLVYLGYIQSIAMTWDETTSSFKVQSGQSMGKLGQYYSFLAFIDAGFNYWTSTSKTAIVSIIPSMNDEGKATLSLSGNFGSNAIGGLCILVGNDPAIENMLGYYDYFTKMLFTKQ